MKKILSILLGITLAAYSSMAMAADTTTIWVSKSSDNTAKICTDHPYGYDGSKCIGTKSIRFVDDATWETVKHSYDVSSSELAAISSKGASIVVHGDGGISVACGVCKAKK